MAAMTDSLRASLARIRERITNTCVMGTDTHKASEPHEPDDRRLLVEVVEELANALEIAHDRIREELARGISGPDEDTGPAARMDDVSCNLADALASASARLEGKA